MHPQKFAIAELVIFIWQAKESWPGTYAQHLSLQSSVLCSIVFETAFPTLSPVSLYRISVFQIELFTSYLHL